MPLVRRPSIEVAHALADVAPIATRWIERLLAQHDPPLTVGQHLALRAIDHGLTSVGALAHAAGVSGSAMSQLLAGLVDAGLVEGRPERDDRRRQELSLTAPGSTALRSVNSLVGRELGALLEGIPPHEGEALSHGLERIAAVLTGTAPPRRTPPPPPPRRPRSHRRRPRA